MLQAQYYLTLKNCLESLKRGDDYYIDNFRLILEKHNSLHAEAMEICRTDESHRESLSQEQVKNKFNSLIACKATPLKKDPLAFMLYMIEWKSQLWLCGEKNWVTEDNFLFDTVYLALIKEMSGLEFGEIFSMRDRNTVVEVMSRHPDDEIRMIWSTFYNSQQYKDILFRESIGAFKSTMSSLLSEQATQQFNSEAEKAFLRELRQMLAEELYNCRTHPIIPFIERLLEPMDRSYSARFLLFFETVCDTILTLIGCGCLLKPVDQVKAYIKEGYFIFNLPEEVSDVHNELLGSTIRV